MNTSTIHAGEQALARAVINITPYIDEFFSGATVNNLPDRCGMFVLAVATAVPELEVCVSQPYATAWLKCKLTIGDNYFETSLKLAVIESIQADGDNTAAIFNYYKLTDSDLQPYLDVITISLEALNAYLEGVRDAEDALDTARAKIPNALQRAM